MADTTIWKKVEPKKREICGLCKQRSGDCELVWVNSIQEMLLCKRCKYGDMGRSLEQNSD